MGLTIDEFKNRHKRIKDKRVHKIIHSLGVRQAFLYIQRNKWFNIGKVLKEAQFQQIIRQVNELLAYELMNGNEIVFPQRMGSIELRTFQCTPLIKDGKVGVNYPVNWDATLELWYTDKESYDKKTLVRYNNKKGYKLLYNKADANYENKSFIQFNVNRDIKCIINKHIKNGSITDTFSL